ncbi:MAG: hypothetical protein ACRD3G_26565 [Vicinamibacterales bacterium]
MSDQLIVISDLLKGSSELTKRLDALAAREKLGDVPYAEMFWIGARLFELAGAQRSVIHVREFEESEDVELFKEGLRALPGRSVFLVSHRDVRGHKDELSAGVPCTIETIVHFAHEPDDPVYRRLLDLAGAFNVATFDAAIDAIKNRYTDEAATITWWVHLTHHKLSHLFLPIDLDLQGWRDSGWKAAYLEEIIAANRARGLGGLVDRARSLLYHGAPGPALEDVERFFKGDRSVAEAIAMIRNQVPAGDAATSVVTRTIALIDAGSWEELKKRNGAAIDEFRKALAEIDAGFEQLIQRVDGRATSAGAAH